ncbi:MAG: thiamine-phosphate kinase [Gemmatimonadales bacterium]|nr:MAG: thiamine-phosphate kinase [Gemmatimonadales bacterium]
MGRGRRWIHGPPRPLHPLRPGASVTLGGEASRIRAFLQGLQRPASVQVGAGEDDAAVLSDGRVVTCDLSLEGVHFSLDWISPREAGARAVAASVSDLAAMGARPEGILAALVVPSRREDPDLDLQVMEGVRSAAARWDAPLLGGDLVRAPRDEDRVALDITALGRASRPLLRSGARPGDRLWVSGELGAAAAAVEAWQEGRGPGPALRQAFVDPVPRLELGRRLGVADGVRAALDLSDGLSTDAHRMAAASGVGLLLEAERIPVARGARLHHALHGGEDYELLVAISSDIPVTRVEQWARGLDVSLSPIGGVVEGTGVHLAGDPGGPGGQKGGVRPLAPGGWDPFRDEEGEGEG